MIRTVVKVLALAILAAFFLLLPFAILASDIAPIQSWPVNVADYQAHDLTIRRGETIILQPIYYQGSTPIDLSAVNAVTLRYRTAAMTNTYYYATGAVYQATSGAVRIRWTPANESTQQVYQYEIATASTNATILRAFGRITLDGGLGAAVEAPPTVHDWGYVPTSQPGVVAGDIAPVLAWTVPVDAYQSYDLTVRHGETVILQPTFMQGTNAINLAAATAVVLRYGSKTQTNCYALGGYVQDGGTAGTIGIRWTPAAEPSNAVSRYEIAVMSDEATLLRAFGTLTIADGLSPAVSNRPASVTMIDWSTVINANSGSAPFPTTAAMQQYVAQHVGVATGLQWGALFGSITSQVDLAQALSEKASATDPRIVYALTNLTSDAIAEAGGVTNVQGMFVGISGGSYTGETWAFYGADSSDIAGSVGLYGGAGEGFMSKGGDAILSGGTGTNNGIGGDAYIRAGYGLVSDGSIYLGYGRGLWVTLLNGAGESCFDYYSAATSRYATILALIPTNAAMIADAGGLTNQAAFATAAQGARADLALTNLTGAAIAEAGGLTNPAAFATADQGARADLALTNLTGAAIAAAGGVTNASSQVPGYDLSSQVSGTNVTIYASNGPSCYLSNGTSLTWQVGSDFSTNSGATFELSLQPNAFTNTFPSTSWSNTVTISTGTTWQAVIFHRNSRGTLFVGR